MAAGENFDARHRPRAHLSWPGRLVRLHRGVILLRRKRRPVVGLASRRVEHDVASPVVPDMTVRVREVHRNERLDLPGPRLEAVHAAVGLPKHWSPGRLDLRPVKDALLHVQRAAGIEREAVDRVVRVRGVESVEQVLLHVVAIVAVGVLEEHEVRLVREDHAAVVELEAGRVVQVTRKDRALVGLPVAVGVLEDQQLVVHRRLRLPVRDSSSTTPPRAARAYRRPSGRD